MTNPYRIMCSELLAWAEHTSSHYYKQPDVLNRARALLAQPVAEVLTDEEWDALVTRAWDQHKTVGYQGERFMYDSDFGNALDFVRRELARWGHPTPQPVAVSERLPGPEDCDEQGRCWMFGNVEGDWRLISATNSGIPKLKYCFSHWLPANALPIPRGHQ